MVNYTPKKSDSGGIESVSIRSIMVKSFISFKPDENVLNAAKTLVKQEMSGAPVLDEQKHLLGFLSEKDCLKMVFDMKYHNLPPDNVTTYMSKTVTTVNPEDSLTSAIDLFSKYSFHIVPVVEEGVTIGILTRHAVTKALADTPSTTW